MRMIYEIYFILINENKIKKTGNMSLSVFCFVFLARFWAGLLTEMSHFNV